MRNASKLRLAGTLGAVIALGALTAGGSATAGASTKGIDATIKIKGNDEPHFVGPKEVPVGGELQIENLTKPNRIGPHTFSLVTKDQLPKGKEEIKRCEHLHLICKDIFQAHDIDPNTFEVGQPDVDNGVPGWETPFDGNEDGDSWFTETKDETTSRPVSSEVGAKFHYMCIVHPFMQGKYEVGLVKH